MDTVSYLLGKKAGGGGSSFQPIIVDELPETGETGVLYLVPIDDTTTEDYYDEFLWIENRFEKVGNTKIHQLTAGNNISIDSNNAINCDIPYQHSDYNSSNKYTMSLGYEASLPLGTNSTVIGGKARANFENCVVIGANATGTSFDTIVIGAHSSSSKWNSVVIGRGASNINENSIVLGRNASSTKANQAMFGSSSANINEAGIYTSNGYKVLATEEYADSKASQVSTMPTASADYLDKIVQFTGTTDSTYTNGYFYKCVSDGADPATYSWEEVEVQAGGGGASYTAGTNISIDSNNAINCDIPYSNNSANNCVKLGSNMSADNASYAVNVGDNISNNGSYTVAIGKEAEIRAINGTAVGYRAKVQFNHNGSIAIGAEAYTTAKAQCVIGGQYTNEYINEIIMSTSSGRKKMATEDYVTQRAYELAGLSAYDSTATYSVDDYVYYNNLIYKCNTAISTAEAWDSTKWTQKTYMEYMSDILNS